MPAPALLRRAAPAKLNLGLHVLRRRADGYHDLETVFLPIAWADVLEAEPAPALALSTSDPALPADARNLVWRAAEALASHAGIVPAARLHLEKHVPYGAGLGGGSSDAAAALRLLAQLWKLDVTPRALHEIATALGADVPFFLGRAPALGEGIGERLTPLRRADGALYRCPFALCVAVPEVHVSTAEAYRLVAPHDRGRPDVAAVVLSDDLERWRRELTNDFQVPVEAAHPAIAAARRALAEAGAAYAAMSGSGAAVFGVFESDAAAAAAAEALGRAGLRTWSGRQAGA